MNDAKEFFLTVTQRMFSNWTALRMAVEHGMGPKARAVEFCPYIADMIFMNERLESAYVAAELEYYMDVNFSTELEDDSATQVANELLRFYRYCVEGNEAVALAEMGKLSPLQPWIIPSDMTRHRNIEVHDENDDTCSDSDEHDETEMDTTNEQWVEVKSKRKK